MRRQNPTKTARHHQKWIDGLVWRDLHIFATKPGTDKIQPQVVQKMFYRAGLRAIKQCGLKNPQIMHELGTAAILLSECSRNDSPEMRREVEAAFQKISNGRQFAAAFSANLLAVIQDFKKRRVQAIAQN